MTSIVENRDCMEAMREFPDKFFDLAVVDPPYGIGISNKSCLGRSKFGTSKATQKNGSTLYVKRKEYTKKSWDNDRPTIEYFNQLFRVSKHQIVFGGNYFTDMLPVSNSWIFWDKQQTATGFSDGELAWCSIKCGIFKIVVRWNGMLQYDMKNKENRIHPTHKPIRLYQKIYDSLLPGGGRVLDTHLGGVAIELLQTSVQILSFMGSKLIKNILMIRRLDSEIIKNK